MADKLMIVAHPDDEVIFGGAHLLRESNWKVICATNADKERRAREFAAVMKRLHAEFEIWNFRDTYSSHFDRAGFKARLRGVLGNHDFRKVVTHGFLGEYGHPQHKEIARIAWDLIDERLYMFAVGDQRLDRAVIEKKRKLLNRYESQRKTIRELRHDEGLDRFIERELFVRVK